MNIYDLKVKTRKGDDSDLSTLKGKVSLVVNTATGCGFTPQYEAIEKLYEKYHDQSFEVLDFPCNQFGHQAPGSDDEIHAFCTAKYQTQFDQFAKIEVNGDNASEVYKILKSQQPTEEPKGLKNKMPLKAIAKIASVNIDTEDELAEKYAVSSIPCLVLFKNGEEVKRNVGRVSKKELEKMLGA